MTDTGWGDSIYGAYYNGIVGVAVGANGKVFYTSDFQKWSR
jgi:hypothetical protein